MKIGIVGTGNMGRSLGLLWTEQGHEVCFGAREVDKAQAAVQLAQSNGFVGAAHAGSNDEAARFGDVVLYTARGVPPAEALSDLKLLTHKIVIDLNNQSIPDGFAYEPITVSLAEKLQAQIPEARVVKAFNTMAQEVFELSPEPLLQRHVSVFVAGDDEVARQTVMQLAQEIGFVSLDCGPLRNARLIEGLGDLIRYVMIEKGSGSYTAISVHPLPNPEHAPRLGGRQASQLDS